jgi:hypothetical protein
MSSNFKIAAIPIALVDVLWDEMAPHLARAVETAHGEVTLESIKANMLTGDVLPLVVTEEGKIIAALTAEIRVMESGMRCLVLPIIGGNIAFEWVDQFLEVAKGIAVEFNCTELRGFATRKGLMKMLEPKGFKEAHVVMTCQLDDLKLGE